VVFPATQGVGQKGNSAKAEPTLSFSIQCAKSQYLEPYAEATSKRQLPEPFLDILLFFFLFIQKGPVFAGTICRTKKKKRESGRSIMKVIL
jgi:hypothetical protein